MKKTIPIPGEKAIIRAAIEKARKQHGPLTAQNKRSIARKVHKKMARAVKTGAILALFGISAVGTKKILDEPKTDKPSFEEEQRDFREEIKVSQEELQVNKNESKIRQEVEQIEDKDTLLRYLKNLYIERYEEKMGETDLTTDNIQITSHFENYVYCDESTGQIYTTRRRSNRS